MKTIKNIWWLSLIIGIFFLSLGITLIIEPGILLSIITVIIGIGFLFTGVKDLVTGFLAKKDNKNWWNYTVYSAINIIVGALLILNPGVTTVVIIWYLAFWALFRGITQIVFGIKFAPLTGTSITTGIIVTIMGIIMVLYPTQISDVIMTFIGICSVLFGTSQIILASNTRRVVNAFSNTNIVKEAQIVKR